MSKEPPVGAGFGNALLDGSAVHLSEGEQWLQQMLEDDSNERRTGGAPDETVVGDGSAWT